MCTLKPFKHQNYLSSSSIEQRRRLALQRDELVALVLHFLCRRKTKFQKLFYLKNFISALLTIGGAQALAPLLQRNLVVIVGVTTIKKGSNAALHREEGRSQGKQLMAGDMSIMGLLVQVAELPDDGVDPPVGHVVVVRGGLSATFRLGQPLADDGVQPLAHPPGKVLEDGRLALANFLALAVVVDVHVLVVGGAVV